LSLNDLSQGETRGVCIVYHGIVESSHSGSREPSKARSNNGLLHRGKVLCLRVEGVKVVVNEAIDVHLSPSSGVEGKEKGVLAAHLSHDSARLPRHFGGKRDEDLLGRRQEGGVDVGADANRVRLAELRAEVELEPRLLHTPLAAVMVGAGLRSVKTKEGEDDARVPNECTVSDVFDTKKVGEELAWKSVLQHHHHRPDASHSSLLWICNSVAQETHWRLVQQSH
jgi:hypothetical protein